MSVFENIPFTFCAKVTYYLSVELIRFHHIRKYDNFYKTLSCYYATDVNESEPRLKKSMLKATVFSTDVPPERIVVATWLKAFCKIKLCHEECHI